MRGLRPVWFAFFASAASLCAADQTVPPPAEAADNPSGNSIEAAKRQFELLKSARDDGPAAKGLPRLSVPELHSAPAETLRKSTPVKPQASGSGNWLIEAMEKSGDERKERERGERGREKEEERTGRLDLSRDDKSGMSADADLERRSRERDAAMALNPLTPFLAQWMTPQDYALLGSGIEGYGASGEFLRRHGAAGALGPVELGAGVTPRDVTVISGSPGKPGYTNPPENPYLQGLNTPLAAPAAVGSVTGGPLVPAPVVAPSVYSAPRAPVAAPPKVPDFAKPQADEKYFKQLKRF